jgi:hypothetical protein
MRGVVRSLLPTSQPLYFYALEDVFYSFVSLAAILLLTHCK